MERLLYRSRRVPAIYVLVLTPTRELAVQVTSWTAALNGVASDRILQNAACRVRNCFHLSTMSQRGHLDAEPVCAQVHSMITKLAQFTDMRVAMAVGGLSLQVQAATLRSSPEIVVATPVSLIDSAVSQNAMNAQGQQPCQHAVRLTHRSRFLACCKPSARGNPRRG